jgi:hypothetical protein
MSPSLNVCAERYVRSVREECPSRIVPFGEEGLRRALNEFVAHSHEKRNHQGKDNLLLFPSAKRPLLSKDDAIGCQQRLGGMLKYEPREAA